MKPKANIQENPYLPKPFKVLEFFRESPDTFTLTVNMSIQHEPGQFVQVSLPGIGECPISICSYSDRNIKLNVRQVGNVTTALARLRKGHPLLLRGPYGKGYPMKQLAGNNLVIVGGGCGIAPLKGVIDYIEENRDDYRAVQLFLGYQSPDDILFRRELAGWKKKYDMKVTVDENPEGKFCYDGEVGFITSAVEQTELDNRNKAVFICGPPVMMKYVIAILQKKGFRDEQIFISAERLMYCGFGICCHCMIRGKFTCMDGPVFRYDEIRDFKND